jgi:hypothetical protein
MNCRRFRQAGGVALVGFALLVSVSCSKTVREGRSPGYLVIDRLQAAAGGSTVKFDDTLESDVVTKGSIFEDLGQLQVHVALKDAGTVINPTQPSPNNLITLERYHVTYVRSDGRNTQGVDVPYAFDGALTGTVGKETLAFNFVIVRAQAKAEAPLKALRSMGGALLISTFAEITFYGHDQVGNAVTASGTMSVNFADWADSENQ